jgi:hypothetical protein
MNPAACCNREKIVKRVRGNREKGQNDRPEPVAEKGHSPVSHSKSALTTGLSLRPLALA